MTVTLYVNWREKEILTAKTLEERIDARVEESMRNTDTYDEYLDDYIDCNYTKRELFDVLSGSDAEREEVLDEIRSEVADSIYEWCDMDTRSDYSEVEVEV